MARGKAHSPEVKAAVIAALLAGQGVNEVAKEHGLSSSVVSRMKSEIGSQRLEQVGVQKKERLVDLIEAHLTASLKGAAKVAEQAHDDIWRNKQPADALAVFYGVLSDKAFRLVEVAGRVFAENEQAS